jgi:hypothetical protein
MNTLAYKEGHHADQPHPGSHAQPEVRAALYRRPPRGRRRAGHRASRSAGAIAYQLCSVLLSRKAGQWDASAGERLEQFAKRGFHIPGHAGKEPA